MVTVSGRQSPWRRVAHVPRKDVGRISTVPDPAVPTPVVVPMPDAGGAR